MSDLMHASLGLIQAEARRGEAPWQREPGGAKWPFVTIARQIGAGGDDIAHTLAAALNAQRGEESPAWRAYDRELVEQIAHDHHLSRSLVELLEDTPYSWLQEVIESMDFNRPSEQALTRRVVETVRALAEAGHAVIVGRGGVFITRDMPGGVHVQLVAPMKHRVARLAQEQHISEPEAARRVREIDLNRERFYARHFARLPLEAASFDLTVNTARVSTDAAVRMIAGLVPTAAPRTATT